MNQPSLAFAFQFQSDGAATSVTINLTSGPVSFFPASTGSTTPTLNGSLAISATSATGLSCTGGLTVTSASILLGVLTVSFSGTQTAGETYVVFGTLLF